MRDAVWPQDLWTHRDVVAAVLDGGVGGDVGGPKPTQPRETPHHLVAQVDRRLRLALPAGDPVVADSSPVVWSCLCPLLVPELWFLL